MFALGDGDPSHESPAELQAQRKEALHQIALSDMETHASNAKRDADQAESYAQQEKALADKIQSQLKSDDGLWHRILYAQYGGNGFLGLKGLAALFNDQGPVTPDQAKTLKNEVRQLNALIKSENAASSAAKEEYGKFIDIFRSVDGAEFDSIAERGRFELGRGMMEGKWFATNHADAESWGGVLNNGDAITVTTSIPETLYNQLHQEVGNLDGIGPAVYANAEQLDAINEAMTGIKISDPEPVVDPDIPFE